MRLKFPVFEIINMAMTFTAFSPGMYLGSKALRKELQHLHRCAPFQ